MRVNCCLACWLGVCAPTRPSLHPISPPGACPQRELIDTSFRKLRSAEGAFELLSNFKSIESRGAIQQQMMNKLVDILEQFHWEIGAAQEVFDRCRAQPPMTRNQPPVAGRCGLSAPAYRVC